MNILLYPYVLEVDAAVDVEEVDTEEPYGFVCPYCPYPAVVVPVC